MHYVTVEQLLETGAHFGHLTRRWNPKMQPFIFSEKNGIHIIDLRKTQILLDIARDAAYNLSSEGKIILFVGTKPQSKEIVEREAKNCNMNYVTERWLGGMLTNFQTIRKSIKRLTTIDKMEVDGTFEKITKKERLMLVRERDRLRKFFGGIEDMTRLPGALFVIDIKKEHIAVKEAKILGIPIIAICDTNCDPELVDYPIPANDDSIKTIELISKVISRAILEGGDIWQARKAELFAEDERSAKEEELEDLDQTKVRRKLRERKGKGAPGGKSGKKPTAKSSSVEAAEQSESDETTTDVDTAIESEETLSE